MLVIIITDMLHMEYDSDINKFGPNGGYFATYSLYVSLTYKNFAYE